MRLPVEITDIILSKTDDVDDLISRLDMVTAPTKRKMLNVIKLNLEDIKYKVNVLRLARHDKSIFPKDTTKIAERIDDLDFCDDLERRGVRTMISSFYLEAAADMKIFAEVMVAMRWESMSTIPEFIEFNPELGVPAFDMITDICSIETYPRGEYGSSLYFYDTPNYPLLFNLIHHGSVELIERISKDLWINPEDTNIEDDEVTVGIDYLCYAEDKEKIELLKRLFPELMLTINIPLEKDPNRHHTQYRSRPGEEQIRCQCFIKNNYYK